MMSMTCLAKSKAGAAPEHSSVTGLNPLQTHSLGGIPGISLRRCPQLGHFSFCLANF